MTVVTLDIAVFRRDYPQYDNVADTQLNLMFDIAQTAFDNSEGALEPDLDKRKRLLYLLAAHLCDITFGDTKGKGSGASGAIGRVASASEGSVSVSLDVGQGLPYSQAWYWGQLFWQLTKPYRMFAYFPGIEVGCS